MVTLKVLCAMLFAAALIAGSVIDTDEPTTAPQPILITSLVR